MRRQQATRQFAKMFFNAVGLEAVPGALQELGSLQELMEKSREFRGLLENPRFTREEREKVMKHFSGTIGLSANTVKLILYLAEQSVIASLPNLIHRVNAMYLERKKKAKAVVVTPVDTHRNYDETLKSSLRQITGRDVDIEYVVDPSLLGGVLVKVGSTMYDGSIRGQLRLLKDDLIER